MEVSTQQARLACPFSSGGNQGVTSSKIRSSGTKLPPPIHYKWGDLPPSYKPHYTAMPTHRSSQAASGLQTTSGELSVSLLVCADLMRTLP